MLLLGKALSFVYTVATTFDKLRQFSTTFANLLGNYFMGTTMQHPAIDPRKKLRSMADLARHVSRNENTPIHRHTLTSYCVEGRINDAGVKVYLRCRHIGRTRYSSAVWLEEFYRQFEKQ